MNININMHPIPIEVSDVIDCFFPRVYGYIDKDTILDYMGHTILGLATHYLTDQSELTCNDIKIVPTHFKWMGMYYTADEMERLYLSIQLCETVRRYSGEFRLMLESIDEYTTWHGKPPTIKMMSDVNHILIEGG